MHVHQQIKCSFIVDTSGHFWSDWSHSCKYWKNNPRPPPNTRSIIKIWKCWIPQCFSPSKIKQKNKNHDCREVCREIHFWMDFQMCSENPPLPLSSDVKGPLANEERMTLRMTVRHCWRSYKMGLANVKAMSMGVYWERLRGKKQKNK